MNYRVFIVDTQVTVRLWCNAAFSSACMQHALLGLPFVFVRALEFELFVSC